MGLSLSPAPVLVVLLSGLVIALDLSSNAKTRPPSIYKVLRRNVYFSEAEPLILECIAQGDPKPVYHWYKDEKKLDLDDPQNKNRMGLKSGIGTLEISKAKRQDEGIYQCVAENNFGKSLSIKRNVYLSRMVKFPTVIEPEKKQVILGGSLVLTCTPPVSIPKAKMSWIILGGGESSNDYVDESEEDFNVVNLNERITMDYNGNLYITRVIEEDAQGGAKYVCMANNKVMRSFNQGEDKIVVPFGKSTDQPVNLLWNSETNVLGLLKKKVSFKCIFSGNPQVEIVWRRKGGKWDGSRMKQSDDLFELTIEKLKYDDQGDYECEGSNPVFGTPIKQTFSLKIESKPMWVKQPKDLVVGVEENAVVSCEARGRPTPEVQWFINGNPIESEPPNPRRKVNKNVLEFKSLTKQDSQVVQCNVTNSHGFIWADVYLYVLAIPAEVKKGPQSTLRVAVGQPITISCESIGKPTPKVVWFKGDQELSGARHEIQPNGNMVIRNVTKNDSGNYRCFASNRFGNDHANGTLIVRDPTTIFSPPESVTLVHGNDAIFICGATTDSAETLEIVWLRDGEPIPDNDPRVNMYDKTLKIIDVTSKDTADYTCVARNGLDNATATATLSVRAPPDPPYNVSLVQCYTTIAIVSWVFDKELENFSPVQSFIVEYNTSFNPDIWRIGARESGDSRRAEISLSLWVEYNFRVKAVNSIGVGKPSKINPSLCKTPEGRPDRHPRKVETVGDKTNYLVITWETMPKKDHNAPDFFYNITVKEKDGPLVMNFVETDYMVGRKEIRVDKIYKPYKITVRAQNRAGQPFVDPVTIEGYSGQAAPKVVPENFELDPDKNVTATSAGFRWDPVDTSTEAMQGVFIGYMIRFWKEGQMDTTLREVFIPNTDGSERRRREAENKIRAEVNNLPSYSTIVADVVARNSYFSSNSSNTISFETPEGVPSSVEYLDALFRGSTHFLLEWGEPTEPNGVVIGYKVGYRNISGFDLGDLEVGEMVTRRRMFLGDLKPDTLYRIYVWALTQEGQGEEFYIDARTAESASELAQPIVETVRPALTSVNVTWRVSEIEGARVGSHYFLEYRRLGKGEWDRVKEEKDQELWQQVKDLEEGTDYEVRVVAVAGKMGKEGYVQTPSEIRSFTTGGAGSVKANVLSAGWFIGMMVAIAILLLILIIVCIIKRNRGDKYHVQEKERLRGSNPEDGNDHFNDDENGVAQSQSFENNQEKMPLEYDETDSMEDYGDVDPGKFNEDGSFIGQYGVQKSSEPANASAMSTLV